MNDFELVLPPTSPYQQKINGFDTDMCVAFSLTTILEIYHYYKFKYWNRFSPAFIYCNREVTSNNKTGMSEEKALQKLVEDGVCTFDLFPGVVYDWTKEREKITYEMRENAKKYAIAGFKKLKTTEEVKSTLLENRAIMGIYNKHAVTVYGWINFGNNKQFTRLKYLNSYGKDWGNEGKSTKVFSDFDEFWGLEFNNNWGGMKDMLSVGIDPGHGGSDSGASGPTGVLEKDVNLGIALACKEALERSGIDVVMTRTSDEYRSLFERSNLFNEKQVDLAVSIHCNGSSDSRADYVATFVIEKGHNADICATLVQREIVKETGWPDGGVREKNLHMIRETKMPAILTENGFITNFKQEKWLADVANQKKLGEAHAKGICSYLGLAFKEESKNKTIISDVAPFLKDGRTFLPVRFFVEAFGGRVDWNSETQEVICYLNGKKVLMKIGSKEIKVQEV